MTVHSEEFAAKLLRKGLDELSEAEKVIVHHFAERAHVSKNTNNEFDTQQTFGQRLADHVAAFGGSWTFIIIFGTIMLGWLAVNTIPLIHHGKPFDPYPYILLNLVLSMVAATQAPIIMMSQNRQSAKDRLDASHDYEVNLKAEMEILALHRKMDALREEQWHELIAMQQEQIRILSQLLEATAVQQADE